MTRFAVPFALALSCATPQTPPSAPAAPVAREPVAPLPAAPALLQLRLAPDAALERTAAQLASRGFVFAAPVRPEPEPLERARSLAFATARMLPEAEAEAPKCADVAEVVQASASGSELGATLHLACYTDRLAPAASPGGACRHRLESGCPERGDRVVAALVFDLVGRQ